MAKKTNKASPARRRATAQPAPRAKGISAKASGDAAMAFILANGGRPSGAVQSPGTNGHSLPAGPLRFIDLFCGIGGFRLAFERAGAQCVFSSDWDKFSRQTYAPILARNRPGISTPSPSLTSPHSTFFAADSIASRSAWQVSLDHQRHCPHHWQKIVSRW